MSLSVAEKAEMAIRMVREADELAFDTETSGVDWRFNQPIGYVITAGPTGAMNSVYVPIRHAGGGNLLGAPALVKEDDEIEPSPFEVELARAFKERNKPGRTIGHNMKFDVHMAANAGVMLGRNLACTQNNEAMLDEYTKGFSLEACAERRGVQAKKGDDLYKAIAARFGGVPDRKQMANFWRMPGSDPMVMDYAEGDGITTLELSRAQMPLIREEEMDQIWRIESDLIWTIFRMERRGIRIDSGEIERLREATEQQMREIMASLPIGFNPRSPVDMRNLMEGAGHTDWPTTPKGNPSFTEKWLKGNPEGQKVVSLRQLSNLINSFVQPMQERHEHKGRVHATLNQLKADEGGTISGRFSCQNPNLQQIPKHNKAIGKPFRRIFAADPGHVFFECDWSQAEPRLFAHYSGDKNLLKGYNSTPFVDVHTLVSQMLDVDRGTTAKRMNMGIFTGMQVRTFASHMGWPEDKASEKWHEWYRSFPGVRDFQTKAKHRLKSRGYVKTILGRRCRLEHPRFAYKGTSKIIQGSQADLMKLKVLEIDRMCEDAGDIAHLCMSVHDSIVGQYQDTQEGREFFDTILAHFANVQMPPMNMRVPFVVDTGTGANWSEASYGA
jgi:DNA polymerase-1